MALLQRSSWLLLAFSVIQGILKRRSNGKGFQGEEGLQRVLWLAAYWLLHGALPTCLSFFIHRFSMMIDSSGFVQDCPELNVSLWNILESQSGVICPPGG